MNHKQKLGYMALGAGILAVGIIIGQFVTPDVKALSNGVFDEIKCTKLEVVDTHGTPVITLASLNDFGNAIVITNEHREPAITLLVSKQVGSAVFVDSPNGSPEIILASHEGQGKLIVHESQKTKIALIGENGANELLISGEQDSAIQLGCYDEGNHISVWDKAGNIAWKAPE